MRRLPFRKLMIVLPLAVITGCSADLYPTKEIVSETTDIKGGSWKAYEFTAQRKLRVTLSATVTSGPAVDAITMTNEGYLAWKNAQTKIFGGGQYYFYPGLSAQSIRSISKTAILESGQYVVVLHNSEAKLFSQNTATVEVKITAQAVD